MITLSRVKSQYGFSDELIAKYLPEPKRVKNPDNHGGPDIKLWDKAVVEKAAARPEIAEILSRRLQKQKRAALRGRREALPAVLERYDLNSYIEKSHNRQCRVTLHIGPTNSRKTKAALQALKQAACGAYFGPMRTLAMEVCDILNARGTPCNLLTGEEKKTVPNARVTASTIEMCDYDKHYDIVVIDEAQLIADAWCGANWTKAILLVDAEEFHICLAPEAEELISGLLQDAGIEPEIVRYKRRAPLVFSGIIRDLGEVQRGDVLMAYSRGTVLTIANMLQKKYGIKASCVYDLLPPAVCREEVRKFERGETDIIVSASTIGMGLLPSIHRVIFCPITTFDKWVQQSMGVSRVLQMAGYAGQFGQYKKGEVLVYNSAPHMVQKAIEEKREVEQIHNLLVPFPEEALDLDYPLIDILKSWDNLPKEYDRRAERQNMHQVVDLLSYLVGIQDIIPRKMLLSLAYCPVNTRNEKLLGYFQRCCMWYAAQQPVPAPFDFDESTLDACETKCQALDIYYYVLRQVSAGVDEKEEQRIKNERDRLYKAINKFLLEKGDSFKRRCIVCGKVLLPLYKREICCRCYQEFHSYGWCDDLDELSW